MIRKERIPIVLGWSAIIFTGLFIMFIGVIVYDRNIILSLIGGVISFIGFGLIKPIDKKFKNPLVITEFRYFR